MGQHILLQTYVGESDFIYAADCTGQPVSHAEAQSDGLVTLDQMERHSRSDYINRWFNVQPGDEVTVWCRESEDHELVKQRFRIPEAGMPDPPTSLDDMRTGQHLHEYLEQHCLIVA